MGRKIHISTSRQITIQSGVTAGELSDALSKIDRAATLFLNVHKGDAREPTEAILIFKFQTEPSA